jgi:hypothetical protein
LGVPVLPEVITSSASSPRPMSSIVRGAARAASSNWTCVKSAAASASSRCVASASSQPISALRSRTPSSAGGSRSSTTHTAPPAAMMPSTPAAASVDRRAISATRSPRRSPRSISMPETRVMESASAE